MTERNTVLVTAGPVYGKIDSNKIISNRSRGLWATKFAPLLSKAGYDVVLLVPITMKKKVERQLLNTYTFDVTVETHDGYYDYARICYEYAESETLKGAIMAAAVLNYIPTETYDGKLPTDDETIQLEFKLAPKVINGMKERDPFMTLIGCKLLFDVPETKLVDAAYKVILNSKANAVIANDGMNLKRKMVVHQDQTTVPFDNDFDNLYDHLLDLLADDYYSTEIVDDDFDEDLTSLNLFDKITDKYRDLFVQRYASDDFYLGAVATHCNSTDNILVSPREKGQQFTSGDATLISKIENQTVFASPQKASLNAPLLVRHLEKYPEAQAVLHFHEDLEPIGPSTFETVIPTDKGLSVGLKEEMLFGYPCTSYAPPGTRRDNERKIPGPVYYIKGHGWIIALDSEGKAWEE